MLQLLHAVATFSLEKQPPDTHWIGGWLDPRAGLTASEKRKSLSFNKSTVKYVWVTDRFIKVKTGAVTDYF
jgi:hypothetical protein